MGRLRTMMDDAMQRLSVAGEDGFVIAALYKFVDAILDGRPIDIYNHGDMYRDFTYVTDLVRGIRLLIDTPPVRPDNREVPKGDSPSPVAPYRIVNIGNSDKVRLLDFVEAIEEELGKKATRNYMPMQMGDVPATWATSPQLLALCFHFLLNFQKIDHQPDLSLSDLAFSWFSSAV